MPPNQKTPPQQTQTTLILFKSRPECSYASNRDTAKESDIILRLLECIDRSD